MRDPRIWMWAEACEMLERAERMQRQFFQPRAPTRRPSWEPPVDFYESEHEYLAVIALPGVPADRVEIALEGDAIAVTAERPLPVTSERMLIHRIEIPHGRFERRIRLPPGRLELGRRELRDGCLMLQLLKR